MPRYRLLVEYDGQPFQGWQRQADRPSVQATLEAAVTALSGETTEVWGAGRTDAGVHALGQVAHLDLTRLYRPERLTAGLNAHLRPAPVVVLDTAVVPDDFHARFSARQRTYLYRILNRRAPPAIDRGRVWHVAVPLDAELMHVAAQALIGRHDFSSFRASECQAESPVKTLDLLHVRRRGELIEFHAAARSFLHHQIRNIVGTLRLIGEGRSTVAAMGEVLAACDRRAAGQTAPAGGLYLLSVDYNPTASRP